MDQKARGELFKENMPFAIFIFKKYFPNLPLTEDWIQIAYIGLWRACQVYDPEKGAITTLAAVFIRDAVLNEYRTYKKYANASTVSLSSPIVEGEAMTYEDLIVETRSQIDEVEERISLEQAFASLKLLEEEKKMLQLKAQGGLSQSEIGEHLGHNQAWVSRRLDKIKKRLLATYEP